ncbi:MAG: radical SAM protein [Acidobacteriia bacterium]|nr:radical SAM protein [Terriglobia bacterium]
MPGRPKERAIVAASNVLWAAFRSIHGGRELRRVRSKWAPSPRLRSVERSHPPLGFPRRTLSLCPACVKEVRARVLAGELATEDLAHGHHAEIEADVLERDGKVWMVKTCPVHGRIEDVLSTDPAFMRRMESLDPGRDFERVPDGRHEHGSSAIRYGRGSVLTIDLTNRCNMMCNPCFANANQVGYVYELDWQRIQSILDGALQVKPRRQMSVQFSGGEPTLSPHFIPAVAYARSLGYLAVQAATNGIRFAQDPDFAREAAWAGLRLVYLQFDGVGNEANLHRHVTNLFDVKRRAIDNLHAAGVDVTLVATIVNTVNNHQAGPIVRFVIENIGKVNAVVFQPVSFTGRGEDADDATRARHRYTLPQLAHDLRDQLGFIEPLRDWFPLSAAGPFTDLKDLLAGPEADWGALSCGCHPHCGAATYLVVNEETKQALPATDLVNLDRLLADLRLVGDSARGRRLALFRSALALLRNMNVDGFPANLGVLELLRSVDGYNRLALGLADRSRYAWRPLLVGAMWFQDVFTYDFERTRMCVVPYGTERGEISFCAYNTGIGWRPIIEATHRTATTAEWYRTRGRHAVYAGDRPVPLGPTEGPAAVTRVEERPIEAVETVGGSVRGLATADRR